MKGLLVTTWRGLVQLGALAAVYAAASAQADVRAQLIKIVPSDGARKDEFGGSIALSGLNAVVGAREDDDNGRGSGSVHVFDVTTSERHFKLLPNDGAAFDHFGGSIAMSGTIVVVGASGDDNDNGINAGSAYVFDVTTGQQLFKLLADDGAQLELFGGSVAVSGTTAIVGAVGDRDNGFLSGSAYIFDVTTGQQLFKLLPSDGAEEDFFGGSVAVSGTIAVVSAAGNDDNGSLSGSAYIFDATTGQQLFKLLPDDGATNDLFGASVAVSGTIAVVGAWRDDDNGLFSGSAYIFDATTGQQLFKLLPDDGTKDDRFGVDVVLNDSIAIIGAVGDDDNDNGADAGSAYVFDVTTGRELFKLLPSDGAPEDFFGRSVAVSETTAIAGATFNFAYGLNSGAAYVFDVSLAADINGDGCVDAADLAQLLGAWGDIDLNSDFITNAADLALLLGSWGAGCS